MDFVVADIAALFGLCALTVLAYMIIMFAYNQKLQRLDVVDVAWGLGFVLVAVVSYVVGEHAGARPALVTALTAIWGVRLAVHIGKRRRGKPEDRRYQVKRDAWGDSFAVKAFTSIFLTQGALLLVIALPIIIVNAGSVSRLGLLDYFGTAIWLIGFYFEVVGDAQLSRFASNPSNKGKLLTTGLWHYTRHPNYFGEVTQWWGIGLIALGAPFGYFGFIGVLLITLLITKISGIPLLEQHRAGQPDWEAYKARTSVFFPLPPKS